MRHYYATLTTYDACPKQAVWVFASRDRRDAFVARYATSYHYDGNPVAWAVTRRHPDVHMAIVNFRIAYRLSYHGRSRQLHPAQATYVIVTPNYDILAPRATVPHRAAIHVFETPTQATAFVVTHKATYDKRDPLLFFRIVTQQPPTRHLEIARALRALDLPLRRDKGVSQQSI